MTTAQTVIIAIFTILVAMIALSNFTNDKED